MAKKKAPLEDIQALPSTMDIKKSVDGYKAKIKALETLVESQQEMIAKLNTKRFTIPTQRRGRIDRKAFIRVIIPDTHGAKIDWPAMNAVFRDIENINPKEVVLLGDLLDCGGFLAQHHVWGYVAESEYTFQDDVDQTNVMLDKLQSLCPTADIHFLEGNHDARIEKWCITQALRNGTDAKFLLDRLGIEAVCHMSRRGIHHYKQGVRYMGLRIPATIKLGDCYFTHGTKHGKNAAASMLQRFSGNVVFGHVHKKLMASDNIVKNGDVGAWCPGCLCELQPMWKHSDPTDWTHGYAIQLVRSNGEFLHINVPIIDGQSYLVHLTEGVGK